ncbi:GNAT family N-acetyltransferase [Anaerosalibacter bizertensis]|uniref:GNAT family N-acetyltransferase n=1 Tax=Anaerosalibacter bizertensis TaxID=932217 RepID=UPI001C0E9C98|nr:GNAT family N-acetyltransferase [Anaerosalibacter bizertensis]MBU5294101.1 GNAT family N-acetyltransferase [Anaerosalibacter bizertensis]
MLDFIKLTENDDTYHQEVYNLLKKCGQDMYEKDNLLHWLRPYPIESIKEDVKTKYVFIVKEKEYTVATFMLSDMKSIFFNDDEKFIYLSKFAVLPNMSRTGIGTRCIKYIEKLARKNNFLGIRLDVYDKSEKAIKFYIKNEFVKLFEAPTKHFRVVCMEKRVS